MYFKHDRRLCYAAEIIISNGRSVSTTRSQRMFCRCNILRSRPTAGSMDHVSDFEFSSNSDTPVCNRFQWLAHPHRTPPTFVVKYPPPPLPLASPSLSFQCKIRARLPWYPVFGFPGRQTGTVRMLLQLNNHQSLLLVLDTFLLIKHCMYDGWMKYSERMDRKWRVFPFEPSVSLLQGKWNHRLRKKDTTFRTGPVRKLSVFIYDQILHVIL